MGFPTNGGRKGYAANADIGFVTGLQDYAGGFVITSGNVEGPIDVMRMDANGQVNHSFGDYGIVETSYGGTWYNPKTTVVTADSQIVTAFLDDSTDTYILEWLNGSGTVVSTTTMDLEKLDSLSLGADGTILAFGHAAIEDAAWSTEAGGSDYGWKHFWQGLGRGENICTSMEATDCHL